MHVHMLQGGLNALALAAIGNHEEVVRTLVGEFGLSVNHRDNVSYTSAVSQLQCRSVYDIHCSLNGSDRDCSLCTSTIECKSDEEYAWPNCVHVGISIQKSLSNLFYIRHTYLLCALLIYSYHHHCFFTMTLIAVPSDLATSIHIACINVHTHQIRAGALKDAPSW